MKLKNFIYYFLKVSFLISFLLFFPLSLFSQVNDTIQTGINMDSLKKSEPGLNVDSLNNSIASDTVGLSKNIKSKSYIPDTLYLKTGDRITGRILSFEQGRLKIDGQGPGVISIKWYKILSISGGNRIFKVEDINGVKYFGRIGFSDVQGEIDVLGKLKYGVMLENIVRIYPLEAEWYRGIKGSLGAGLNYAKSSDVLTVNAQYNLYYVISKWRFINDFSYVSTSTTDNAASVRIQTNLQALYALSNNWMISEINSFNRNDELGVKSRFSFGAGGGNSIVQTDWQRLLVLTGLVENLEKNIENHSTNSNIEWSFSLQHTIYKFISPNLSSSTSIASFVGVTEKGRYRLDASTDITWEFVTNFKLQISFYYNYDNKNIEGKNTKRDYGTVISLLLDLK